MDSNSILLNRVLILILGVCILLRVWDQGEGGFPSTQRLYPTTTKPHMYIVFRRLWSWHSSDNTSEFLNSLPRGLISFLHNILSSHTYWAPGVITWLPCSWGIWMREPGPPGWGSLRWDSKVCLRVLIDSDHWVIALQITTPSSRQRGRPTETRPQISDSNIPTGSNIWSEVTQGCSIPRHTDWPSGVK
jgi:hypothetical protein